MTPHLSEQLLSRLSRFIADRFGLHFPPKRWRDLERRVGQAARDFGCSETEACVEWLLTAPLTPEQTGVLVRQLTIGETYFFREKSSFEHLESTILPALIAARRGRERRLRLWSAGCSTGEEPYSLAILLSRLLPDLAEWHVTILATDLNPAALAKAARGSYRDWSFRGTPPWLRDRYFRKSGEGDFVIADAIRAMVTFAPLNLAQDCYPSLLTNTNAMDVIFCRNVLMYFVPEEALRVIGSLHRALLPGGWLAVSPCETSHQLFREFETVSFPGAIFYRNAGEAPPLQAGRAQVVPSESPFPSQPAPLPLPPAAPFETASAACEREEKGDATPAAMRPGDERAARVATDAATLARSLANQGRLSEALVWADKALVAAKLDPELHYLRATIHQELGDEAEAVAALKRALYLDHDFALAHFALGNLTLHQRKMREADRHFTNTLHLLERQPADETLSGAEGMTVKRLAEIVTALRETVARGY
jgi:chemotaxis protein methyltransferase CheR